MPKTRTFLLRDRRHPQDILATLTVTDSGTHSANSYTIKITDDSAVKVPLVLDILERHAGSKLITGKRAADWIASRATPAGRQNINETLRACGLKKYDAWGIVQAHNCKSTRDYVYMEEVETK